LRGPPPRRGNPPARGAEGLTAEAPLRSRIRAPRAARRGRGRGAPEAPCPADPPPALADLGRALDPARLGTPVDRRLAARGTARDPPPPLPDGASRTACGPGPDRPVRTGPALPACGPDGRDGRAAGSGAPDVRLVRHGDRVRARAGQAGVVRRCSPSRAEPEVRGAGSRADGNADPAGARDRAPPRSRGGRPGVRAGPPSRGAGVAGPE